MPAQLDLSTGTHTCTKCGVNKPLSHFPKRNTRPAGINSSCKDCVSLVNKASYQAGAEKRRVAAKARRLLKGSDLEYQKAYREANREKLREYFRDRGKKRLPQDLAKKAARRARKLKALVAWADTSSLRLIYDRATTLSKELGEQHQVDHIVPLAHPLVCGLHCEANLQIIPAEENLRKGNRYWPDMP